MQLPANMNAPEPVWRVELRPFRRIDESLQRVRAIIRQSLQTTGAAREIAPLYEYLSARNGKMVRPGLVLLVGQCVGKVTDEHLQVAAMVEMIHDATLLHDDVIDDGHRRRGAPTVNSLWGNEPAVLLGDFVLSRVFKMAADLDPAVARVLAETAQRVCEGELRQVMQKRNWQLTEVEYIDIIMEKSASFFSGCCRLGALLAGASRDWIEAASSYGLSTGIAFQIMDDILDIAGDESRMGKQSQSDLDNSKPTLAVIHLLGHVRTQESETIRAMLKTPGRSRSQLALLLAENGSLEYAHERARQYVDEAIEALNGLPEGEARDALAETARLMVDRTT